MLKGTWQLLYVSPLRRHNYQKLVDSCLIFFRKHGLIISEVFWYSPPQRFPTKMVAPCTSVCNVLVHGKGQESRKMYFITVQKKFIFLRRFDSRNTFFLDIEKSDSKRLFSNDSKCKSITRGQLIKDKNR